MRQTLDPETIRAVVREAAPHSDDPAWLLEWYAEQFVRAYAQAPLGHALEVGARAGGSAYVWLRLLEELYGAEGAPTLFTVDPYGQRPYHDGAVHGRYTYGPDLYRAQKQLLAPFANHVHFHMTSREFLTIVTTPKFALRYWRNGSPRPYRGFSWVYLDGEHDLASVAMELRFIYETPDFLAPGGLVCVDNVDWDPAMKPFLRDAFDVTFNEQGVSALIHGLRASDAADAAKPSD